MANFTPASATTSSCDARSPTKSARARLFEAGLGFLVEVRTLAIRTRKGGGVVDAARLCGLCVLRGLRAHRVHCDRCVGTGRADRNNNPRRHAKNPVADGRSGA